ncbi:MAG: class II aldolase/adducin family protein [Deltaproteobacteria bacterium]|nr:class II aldolase/adducin family protein [Deltaproteobacteria bacterium]
MSGESLCAYSRLVWERGWVANHDGNLSLRIGADRYLATPTAFSKRSIAPADLVTVDGAGTVLEGTRKVFSEWNLHAAAFDLRPDAMAVIHAHPPHATAAGLTGLSLERLPLPEAVVSLGRVPTARFVAPGPESAAEVRRLIVEHDVILLPGNGLLAVGDDLEMAYLRVELAEHLARILTIARQQGRAARLDPALEEAMLQKRTAAGLGPAGRAAKGKAAPAGAPSREAVAARVAVRTGDARLAAQITDEVMRRLATK